MNAAFQTGLIALALVSSLARATPGLAGDVVEERLKEVVSARQASVSLLGGQGWPFTSNEAVLRSQENPTNVWLQVMAGTQERNMRRPGGGAHWHNAIGLAGNNPWLLLALGLEFGRQGDDNLALQTLQRAEGAWLRDGLERSAVLGTFLLRQAELQESLRDSLRALALRADRSMIAPSLDGALGQGPVALVTRLSQIVEKAFDDWVLQVQLARTALDGLRLLVVFVTMALLALLAHRHLPLLVHDTAERLPSVLPMPLRHGIAWIAPLLLLLGGLVAFLAGLALLLSLRVRGSQRIQLLVCGGLLALTPLDARIQYGLARSLDPNQPMGLLARTHHAPPGPTLLWSLEMVRRQTPSCPILHLAIAAASLKQGHANQALAALDAARRGGASPKDPLFGTTLAVALLRVGLTAEAQRVLLDVLDANPRDPWARVVHSISLGEVAPSTSNALLETWRADVKRLHSVRPPATLQYPIPRLDPWEFWTRHFPRLMGSWSDSTPVWGRLFGGLEAGASMVFLLGLIALGTALSVTGIGRRGTNLATACPLCGSAFCTRCGSGNVCPTCQRRLINLEPAPRRREQVRILADNLVRREVTGRVIGAVVPGLGALWRDDRRTALATALMVISCGMLVAGVALLHWEGIYPSTHRTVLTAGCWGLLGLWHSGAALSAGVGLVRFLKKRSGGSDGTAR